MTEPQEAATTTDDVVKQDPRGRLGEDPPSNNHTVLNPPTGSPTEPSDDGNNDE
jgi:hypothetical protein